MISYMHSLQGYLPAFNDFIQTKSLRVIPFPGVIELAAIYQSAFIMYSYDAIQTGSIEEITFSKYQIKNSARHIHDIILCTQNLHVMHILQFIFFFSSHKL